MTNSFSSHSPEYLEYLQSPQWARTRATVFQRDRKICQGCLKVQATEVHHLTYKHVYAEFMFELISLCSDCHDRVLNVFPALKDGDFPWGALCGRPEIFGAR
jgi:5-methylcytosine-specific restriction endonuclease McrA